MQSEQQMTVCLEWQPPICYDSRKANFLSNCLPQVQTRVTIFQYESQTLTEATPNWNLLEKQLKFNIQSVDFHFIFQDTVNSSVNI